MNIVFTTTGGDLNAPLDPRFGRAARFLVYNSDTAGCELVDNQNLNASHGAGIQAAETVVGLGAKALVTGHCGPKAFRVLQAAGVAIYTTEATTVAEALALYREGKLSRALAANAQGHRP